MSASSGDPTPSVSRATLASTFARSFLIQGSWNYRTMIGGGFAFALLPVLRRLYEREGPELAEALSRHAEHFNAHPYLAALGIGAAARLELEDAEPETIRRFKSAVRGPLGGLGDALVWAAWLPCTLLVALVLAWAGASATTVVVVFLVLYNLGHVILRVWGFSVGLRAGRGVGGLLKASRLDRCAEWTTRIAVLLLGALVGLLAMVDTGFGTALGSWGVLGAGAFVVGLLGGQRLWRPAAYAVVGMVGALLVFQIIS